MATQTNIRIAQQKSKDSITILLPMKETGIKPGDGVIFEVINNGYIILKKVESSIIPKDESFAVKLLEKLGIHKHYELKKRTDNELIG